MKESKEPKKILKSTIFGGTYTEGGYLGKGAQAKVFKFNHKAVDGKITTYACKETPMGYIKDVPQARGSKRWNNMVRELVILEIIDSPNVIKVHEFIRTSRNFYMIQEYANGGSLQTLLDLKGSFAEPVAKTILKQIINGLSALYAIKVVHRDLKLDNILISFPKLGLSLTKEDLKNIDLEKEEFVVKIADLGFSRALVDGETAKTNCGTPLQMAPEVLFQQKYDYKVDVWALGGIYFTLLTNMYVFNANNMAHLEKRVRQGDWEWPTKIPFSIQGLQFLQKTFQYRAENRLSWDQIVSHPYLSMKEVDMVQLQILYSDPDAETSSYKNDRLIINTRDPTKFEELYSKVSAKMMKENEAVIEKGIEDVVTRHSKSSKFSIQEDQSEGLFKIPEDEYEQSENLSTLDNKAIDRSDSLVPNPVEVQPVSVSYISMRKSDDKQQQNIPPPEPENKCCPCIIF